MKTKLSSLGGTKLTESDFFIFLFKFSIFSIIFYLLAVSVNESSMRLCQSFLAFLFGFYTWLRLCTLLLVFLTQFDLIFQIYGAGTKGPIIVIIRRQIVPFIYKQYCNLPFIRLFTLNSVLLDINTTIPALFANICFYLSSLYFQYSFVILSQGFLM